MNTVATILILLAPVGLVYAWVFCWTRMRPEPGNWRGWATLGSLVLASVAILLGPVSRVLMPRGDWQSGVELIVRFSGRTLGRGVLFASCR